MTMNRGKQTLCATGLLLVSVPWAGGCKNHCCQSPPAQDPFAAHYGPGAVAPILPGDGVMGGAVETTPQPSLIYPLESGMPAGQNFSDSTYAMPSTSPGYSSPAYSSPQTYNGPQTYNVPPTTMPGGSNFGTPYTVPGNQPTPTPVLRPQTSSSFYPQQPQTYPSHSYPSQSYPSQVYPSPSQPSSSYRPQSYHAPQGRRYYPQPGSYSQPGIATPSYSSPATSSPASSAPSHSSPTTSVPNGATPISPIPESSSYRSTSRGNGPMEPFISQDGHRTANRGQAVTEQPAPHVSRHVPIGNGSAGRPNLSNQPDSPSADNRGNYPSPKLQPPATQPNTTPAPRGLPQDPIPLFNA